MSLAYSPEVRDEIDAAYVWWTIVSERVWESSFWLSCLHSLSESKKTPKPMPSYIAVYAPHRCGVFLCRLLSHCGDQTRSDCRTARPSASQALAAPRLKTSELKFGG
jgi:hypothetical protein